jgi:predicted Zn finger-like uncharacterized protein
MALATQCPHCHTTFRVAQDQLKLRAGLVRCGHCKEIFNGIEHLLPPTAKSQPASAPAPAPTPPSATPPVSTPAPLPVAPPAAAATEIAAEAAPETVIAEAEAPAAEPVSPIDEEQPADAPLPPAPEETRIETTPTPPAADVGQQKTEPTARPDPLQRMTLVDFTHELPDDLEAFTDYPTEQLSQSEAATPAQADELEEAIRDLQSKPWRGEKKSRKKKSKQAADPLDEADEIDDEEEPGFLKRGRRKQRLSKRLRIAFGLGSLVLLIAALLQGAYAFRNQLAGSFPQAKPWLTQMCNIAGCRIDLPAQISSVSIESSELQTLASAKNRFVLTTLLRNYSTTAQEWPYIELTLNDANEKPLLRRVFKPEDYLPSRNEALAGFPAASERTIKINFELSQVQASGYRVYLFYP